MNCLPLIAILSLAVYSAESYPRVKYHGKYSQYPGKYQRYSGSGLDYSRLSGSSLGLAGSSRLGSTLGLSSGLSTRSSLGGDLDDDRFSGSSLGLGGSSRFGSSLYSGGYSGVSPYGYSRFSGSSLGLGGSSRFGSSLYSDGYSGGAPYDYSRLSGSSLRLGGSSSFGRDLGLSSGLGSDDFDSLGGGSSLGSISLGRSLKTYPGPSYGHGASSLGRYDDDGDFSLGLGALRSGSGLSGSSSLLSRSFGPSSGSLLSRGPYFGGQYDLEGSRYSHYPKNGRSFEFGSSSGPLSGFGDFTDEVSTLPGFSSSSFTTRYDKYPGGHSSYENGQPRYLGAGLGSHAHSSFDDDDFSGSLRFGSSSLGGLGRSFSSSTHGSFPSLPQASSASTLAVSGGGFDDDFGSSFGGSTGGGFGAGLSGTSFSSGGIYPGGYPKTNPGTYPKPYPKKPLF